MNTPIIKLEVEGMKYTVSTALMEHQAQIDASVQAALEAVCHPDNIDHVVRDTAMEAAKAVIESEIDRFFRYGEGRTALVEVIRARLLSKDFQPIIDGLWKKL